MVTVRGTSGTLYGTGDCNGIDHIQTSDLSLRYLYNSIIFFFLCGVYKQVHGSQGQLPVMLSLSAEHLEYEKYGVNAQKLWESLLLP